MLNDKQKELLDCEDLEDFKPKSRLEALMKIAIENSDKPSGNGDNTLKKLLDATQHTYYLFTNYKGSSIDGLIEYDYTSNVTVMSGMFTNCTNLTSVPQLDTSNVTNMSTMFSNCTNLTSVPQLDTSNVTNMMGMFIDCTNLTSVPQLNTSNVTITRDMFSNCTNLTSVPQLNTSKVTNMISMFSDCINLTSIPQLDTSKVTNMSSMFYNCKLLNKIDITQMDATSTSSNNFFAYNCASLTKLIIRNMKLIPLLNSNAFTNCYHFTGTVDQTYNPDGLKDGRIYVPDDRVNTLKTKTNWSTYADIIVPLSTLEE